MFPAVSVIGTIFVDCKGFAKQNYQPDSRNVGRIQFVHGGVGRNVAENLALLGVATTFYSSVDDSGIGLEVLARLQQARVNTDSITRTSGNGMGMWLAILDEKGDLAGSISQMPDLQHLQASLQTHQQSIMEQTSHLVLELDLNEAISRQILAQAKAHQRPVYGIPGNLEVILHNRGLLADLECFICNNYEADRLMDTDFTSLSIDEMQDALTEYVHKSGLRSMVVTLGAKGSVFYSVSDKEAGYQPVYPVQIVDSSGAGDAFFSGTVMGLVRGLPLRDAVICGTKVAGWTIESEENNCKDLADKIELDGMFQGLLVRF